MKKLFNKLNAVIFILGLLTLTTCEDQSSDPETQEPIEPAYDVEYSDNTVVIEDNSDVIISLDTTSGTYTMNAGKFNKKPETGNIIIVDGELMKKVVSVQDNGGEYVVETEDAALTDAIENGEVAWNVTPEWSDVSSMKFNGKKVMDFDGGVTEEIKHTIDFGGIKHQISIKPRMSNGKINACKFTFKMIQAKGGNAEIAFTAEGDVKLPQQETSISISDGELENFRANNKGITADLELSMAAAGGSSGKHSLELPEIALSIPIRAIPTPGGLIPVPIPITIDIGIQFVSQITIADVKSSAQASSKCRISSDGGFEYKGSKVTTSAQIGDHDISNGKFDAAANFGIPVDVQFGVAFPRVSLNIASQELAYIHTGFTTGSSLTWGPICKKGYVKMVVEGGYSLKVLGQTIAEDKKTFAKKDRVAKGDNCK